MNNTFTLSTKPDLKLTVTGFVHSKAIQGVYDLPVSGNVNAALRYGFAKGKGRPESVLQRYIRDRARFLPRIRFQTQSVTNPLLSFPRVGRIVPHTTSSASVIRKKGRSGYVAVQMIV